MSDPVDTPAPAAPEVSAPEPDNTTAPSPAAAAEEQPAQGGGRDDDMAPAAVLEAKSLTLISDSGAEFETLDQLGPTVQTIMRSGRQDLYLEQLGIFIRRKEAEIELLCNAHFQDFFSAVDSLLQIRQKTRELRDRVIGLNDALQESGHELNSKKVELTAARKVQRNLQEGIDVIQKCLNVLNLANKCKTQLEQRNLFGVLKSLDELESVQLRKVNKYSFSKHLKGLLPYLRDEVKKAVIADLKEWFYLLRESSRTTGNLAMKQARNRQNRWRRLSQQRQQQGLCSPVIELVMDEENEENLVYNDQVKIDFRPLYQCIHIHDHLDLLSEFKKNYAEDRLAQMDLILSIHIDFESASKTCMQNLEKLLQEIVGFFVVEHVVVYTTYEFRAKSSVDVVWTVVSDRVTRLIAEATSKVNDTQRLFDIRKILLNFVSSLESYMYDTRKPRELMVILAERYAKLIMEACGEKFKEILTNDDYRPMVVNSEKEWKDLLEIYPFEKPSDPTSDTASDTAASDTATSNTVASDTTSKTVTKEDSTKDSSINTTTQAKYPKTLPFSPAVIQCIRDVKKTVEDYYHYIAGEDGPSAVVAADSVVVNAVDQLLSKTITPLLLSKCRSNDITLVVQVVVNMQHFETNCGLIEDWLTSQKISKVSDPIILRAKDSFREARSKSEKKIFELVHEKIKQFLEVSNYNWRPTASLFTVSQYLQDLVNYLKIVLPDIVQNLQVQVKKFVLMDALDYLATALQDLWFGDHVREFNAMFVATVDIDLLYLERFVEEQHDAQLFDIFTELRQTVNLLITDNREEYLDPTTRNKKYSRLKPATVISLFEK